MWKWTWKDRGVFAAAVAALMLITSVNACTSPGVPTVREGSAASAEILGVSMHGARVYAVRDTKRNVTCWIALTNTGGSISIDCEADPTTPNAPASAAQASSAPPVTAAPPAAPATPPALSPVPPAPHTR